MKDDQVKPTPGQKPSSDLVGTDLADVLLGTKKNDNAMGGLGDDSLKGLNGNDSLFGELGNDLLFGDQGKDKLWGGEGDDQVTGGSGKDKLYGGLGNDALMGGGGSDWLMGADALAPTGVAVLEVDTLTGGNGKDTFVLGVAANGMTPASPLYMAGGLSDYAVIADLKEPDRIQLVGDATGYTLGAAPAGAPLGDGLYYNNAGQQELIAVIANADPALLSLTSKNFVYV